MGSGQARTTVIIPTARPRATQAPAPTPSASAWESRLYVGLRLRDIPPEIRAALVATLGDVGVEAEHFLSLLAGFPGQNQPTRELADLFLLHLEASARRICSTAAALEIATQSYLAALEALDPGIRLSPDVQDVWWTEYPSGAEISESLEIRLRACGYAYRHVVAAHLASNVEAIAEQLALTLHALSMLPPAGVLSAGVLYGGLYDLSSMLQGYLIPNHITDLNPQNPGLLAGITQLRELTSRDDISVESDLAWARAQYAHASHLQLSLRARSEQWGSTAASEWLDCIRALERLL